MRSAEREANDSINSYKQKIIFLQLVKVWKNEKSRPQLSIVGKFSFRKRAQYIDKIYKMYKRFSIEDYKAIIRLNDSAVTSSTYKKNNL